MDDIFSNIYSNKKDEILNSIKSLNSINTVLNEPDTLILTTNNFNELNKLPNIDSTGYDKELFDVSLNDLGKHYVVYEFEKTDEGKIVVVYPNKTYDSDINIKSFGYTYVLKPLSYKEIMSKDIKDIANAVKSSKGYYKSAAKLDINFLKFEDILKIIKVDPTTASELTIEIYSDSQLKDLYNSNSMFIKYLDSAKKLKVKKALQSPEEKDANDTTNLYVFLAKDIFKELDNGNYQKDVEIESLNLIDQYSSDGQMAINMMLLRARVQEGVKLYILWSDKGILEDVLNDDLWKINKSEFKWLRDSIMNRAIPYNKAKKQSL